MKAMRIFITSTVFLLTGILYAQGLDQRCTQMGDSACVDWDRGVVMAEGLGAPASSAKTPHRKMLLLFVQQNLMRQGTCWK